jgi:hypothetical protein
MKVSLLKVAFIAALCLPALKKAQAQPYRQLTINDFEGIPRNNSDVVAYTNCTIDFKYTATQKDNYYLLNFNIRLMMNRYRSWMDKNRIASQDMLAEVLKHEQGHYTIAYLEQQELMREVGKTRFGANYQQEAINIFNRIDAKYKQLNLDYDTDTQHMTNRVQQNSWDMYFKKKLEYLPPVSD